MHDHSISVVSSGFGDGAGLDTGVSHALLERVSEGELPETFRVFVPSRVVAFGKHDRLMAGFARAVEIVRSRDYAPVVRLPGGRAAVFHEETIAVSWTIPTPDPVRGIRDRFEAATAVLTRALARLGVPNAVGEIPGEYCPGEFSIHHAGRIKLAGLGQRLGRAAAHVGGVLVVGHSDAIREVLVPTYAALGIEWDSSTVGAVQDVVPEITVETAIESIIETVAETAVLRDASIDDRTLARARELAPLHLP
jgi:octanoyl-[GcvH]:protein N-octanoyltransferase